jgi:murein tripeptide amidase MpaA
MKKLSTASLALLLAALLQLGLAQDPRPVFQGSTSVAVDTTSRPISKQEKREFSFEADQVTFSNQFDGARLTQIARTGENAYTITITPENAPVNMSPWYAFQVLSRRKKDIFVTLEYPEFARHRYSPQVSKNGRDWKPLDTSRIEEIGRDPNDKSFEARPKSARIRLSVGKDPLWISAQELQNSGQVFGWMDRLARKKRLKIEEIGKSTEGRPIRLMTVGNPNAKKFVMVISRQHPPEVTGYFAMQAFDERIAFKSKLSNQFRKDWAMFVVPLMNPDGVDNGQWRHNGGGIDLNRDWAAFNQPETRAVRDFLKRKEAESGGKFYFGIDFHSTWDDIYYPFEKRFTQTNAPGLMWNWLDAITKSIPNYKPNIRPNEKPEPTIVSRNYFMIAHRMEAIVFEIGDNTPRGFIRTKGEAGADELMKLLTVLDRD